MKKIAGLILIIVTLTLIAGYCQSLTLLDETMEKLMDLKYVSAETEDDGVACVTVPENPKPTLAPILRRYRKEKVRSYRIRPIVGK